jgi:cytidylate kinase
LAQIIKRDQDDRQRSLAPLAAAPDAILLDSTTIPADEVVARMYAHILATSCCRDQ